MKILNIEIDKISGYEKNAKTHPPEQVEKLAKAIKKYGFTQPIVIDENNLIIVGHGRHQAAKLAGLDKVPCVKLAGISEEEVRAMRIFDNKINESPWDISLLAAEIQDLNTGGFDLFETGFAKFELDSFISSQSFSTGIDLTEPAEVTEQIEKPHEPTGVGFKQVQLLLRPEQHEKFIEACKKLGETFNTENVTDTVYQVLIHMAFEGEAYAQAGAESSTH